MLVNTSNFIEIANDNIDILTNQYLSEYLKECENQNNEHFTFLDQEFFYQEYLNKNEEKLNKYALSLSDFLTNSHGEIEKLLEKISKTYLTVSWKLLEEEHKLNSIIASLIRIDPLCEILHTKQELYRKINNNHGIKTHNIELLFPVLFQDNRIDESKFSLFNTLGSSRGQLTHNSLTEKIEFVQKNQDFLKHISTVKECIEIIEQELIKDLNQMFELCIFDFKYVI